MSFEQHDKVTTVNKPSDKSALISGDNMLSEALSLFSQSGSMKMSESRTQDNSAKSSGKNVLPEISIDFGNDSQKIKDSKTAIAESSRIEKDLETPSRLEQIDRNKTIDTKALLRRLQSDLHIQPAPTVRIGWDLPTEENNSARDFSPINRDLKLEPPYTPSIWDMIPQFPQWTPYFSFREIPDAFEEAFPWLDKNDDKRVTKDEIDSIISSTFYGADDPQLMQILKVYYDQLSSLNVDGTEGISRDDMDVLWYFNGQGRMKELSDAITESLVHSRWLIEDRNTRLYGDGRANIVPDGVIQRYGNDSPFMAALASLAQSNPAAIEQMIESDGNGYTVRFPGHAEPIEVSSPTISELVIYNQGGRHGTWGLVLEKAFGKVFDPNALSPADGASLCTSTRQALEILTGNSTINCSAILNSESSMHNNLTNAFQNGWPAVAYAYEDPANSSGITPGQEYSILGYDSLTRTISLRNPRVLDDLAVDTIDGVFTMSLEEFHDRFKGFTYAAL
ncbi:MAG: hypothetical protein K2X77_19795 [Candidatus Obscuribacterales bacterium]|nr:hypothetical protein [Candidatus Obscuribacterales bacterium]